MATAVVAHLSPHPQLRIPDRAAARGRVGGDVARHRGGHSGGGRAVGTAPLAEPSEQTAGAGRRGAARGDAPEAGTIQIGFEQGIGRIGCCRRSSR